MGIRLVIPDLSRFVRTIVVSPEASPEFVEVVENLVVKYELRTRVLQSNLATAAV